MLDNKPTQHPQEHMFDQNKFPKHMFDKTSSKTNV